VKDKFYSTSLHLYLRLYILHEFFIFPSYPILRFSHNYTRLCGELNRNFAKWHMEWRRFKLPPFHKCIYKVGAETIEVQTLIRHTERCNSHMVHEPPKSFHTRYAYFHHKLVGQFAESKHQKVTTTSLFNIR